MKRRRRKTQEKNEAMRVIRLWTHDKATEAVPYFRSLTNSLREHWLTMQSKRLEAERLGDVPRPGRSELIALEEAKNARDAAEDAFNAALEELMTMDVFLLDPVHGMALVPFQQDKELAWYVFDLFDAAGLTSWRFHKDPLDMRRPMPDSPEDSRILEATV